MNLPSWISSDAQAVLQCAGLDIVVPLVAQGYNQAIADKAHLAPIETFGHTHTSALLIGNTKALWPIFKASLQGHHEGTEPHPLDRYVEEVIATFVAMVPLKTQVYFSHITDSTLVSMLDCAQASGFADQGPAYLAVHPELGPWFALRALVVVDEATEALHPRSPRLCADCDAPCSQAFDRAQMHTAGLKSIDDLKDTWRLWLAVRDACPLGHKARYDESQIRYHYTHDAGTLLDP